MTLPFFIFILGGLVSDTVPKRPNLKQELKKWFGNAR